MNDYWSLSITERAALTYEQVAALEAFELMKAGIESIDDYELIPEPEAPEPDATMFTLSALGGFSSEVLFASREDAETVAGLIAGTKESHAFKITEKWGDTVYLHSVRPIVVNEVKPVQVYSERVFRESRQAIDRLGTVRAQNKATTTTNDSHDKAAREVVKPMWDDWYRSKGRVRDFEHIAKTWRDYRSMAGDDAVAIRFLANTFGVRVIDAYAGLGAEAFPGFEFESAKQLVELPEDVASGEDAPAF